MAALTATSISASGAVTVTVEQTTGADTFIYKQGSRQRLLFTNGTAGAATINLLGDTVTTKTCPGQGDPIDNSGGYDVSVPIGDTVIVTTETIKNFLNTDGTATDITGTTGVDVSLLEG